MNNIISFFVIILIVTSCATKKASYFHSEKNRHSTQEIVKKVNNLIQVPDKISLKGKIKIINHAALKSNKLQLNINIKAKIDTIKKIAINRLIFCENRGENRSNFNL